MRAMPAELLVCHLGRVPYREGVELQEQLREQVIAGELPELLLLLEHPPVYTLGRRSQETDLGLGEEWCRRQGIDVVRTDRGGRLTYHGPGQLVGYPIVRVADVRAYVATMEEAIVSALAQAGLPDARGRSAEGPQYTGVWLGERKIASIGVHLSRGVSMHGFAVNVDNDLAPFSWVVACGLPDVAMTSLAVEGVEEGVRCFRKRMGHAFCEAFGARQRIVAPARIAPIPSPA
jgi:lipoyl(octanoyl) transferase